MSETLYLIVLADDDDIDQVIFKNAIKASKFKSKVIILNNGIELMEYLNVNNDLPDVIFLDINMPLKNGLECLQEIRNAADIVIDSSALNIHQLEKKVNDYFNQSSDVDLKVNILSFGYKYGIPVDADLVMDCRFIANPHWDPKLRPLTGMDKSVSKAVLESANVEEFLERYQLLFDTLAKGFITEGRKFLTLAIGCTGGKHRSVAITEELVTRLANGKNLSNYRIQTHGIHRDLGREI